MLDVRRLRALHEVARRGSIAAAAEALAFTPSAVSQQLAKLERETGVALLERGPHSVRLTAAGERLAERAAEIIEQLEDAERELAAPHGAAPMLRLGSFPTGAPIVLEALSLLEAREPDMHVTVSELDPLV